MPANKSTFLKYSEDAVKAAIEDVRLKRISIRAAAKKYGVPRTTLKYKLDGTTPMERKMGQKKLKIIDVAEATATILSMIKCGRLWKWPERPDVLEYQWKSVQSHINEPKKTSKTRNVYSIPELDFLWN